MAIISFYHNIYNVYFYLCACISFVCAFYSLYFNQFFNSFIMVILDACLVFKPYLNFFFSRPIFTLIILQGLNYLLTPHIQFTNHNKQKRNTAYYQIITHLFVVLLIQGVSLHIHGLGNGFLVALVAFICHW